MAVLEVTDNRCQRDDIAADYVPPSDFLQCREVEERHETHKAELEPQEEHEHAQCEQGLMLGCRHRDRRSDTEHYEGEEMQRGVAEHDRGRHGDAAGLLHSVEDDRTEQRRRMERLPLEDVIHEKPYGYDYCAENA